MDALESIELLNPREVARVLRVSRTTVYRWIYTGKLPYLKLGSKSVRIRARDLEDFIARASRGEGELGDE